MIKNVLNLLQNDDEFGKISIDALAKLPQDCMNVTLILNHCNNKVIRNEKSHSSSQQLHHSHGGLVHWTDPTERATFNEIYSTVMEGKAARQNIGFTW